MKRVTNEMWAASIHAGNDPWSSDAPTSGRRWFQSTALKEAFRHLPSLPGRRRIGVQSFYEAWINVTADEGSTEVRDRCHTEE